MITIEDMKSKLLTIDEVQDRISNTEPLGQKHVSDGNKISFAFEPEWAVALDQKKGTDPVEGVIRIDGEDHQLTKDAALQVGASFGLPGKYASKLPNNLLESHLNYWWSNLDDKEFNMLSMGKDRTVAAFTRPTISPFSNAELVNETIEGIRDNYGNTEIYADYKFNHSLVRTDIRFIIPEAMRAISGGGLADVPAGGIDQWAGGIHLTNSLMGKSQTKLETYLFRWMCTNGATAELQGVGTWSRRNAEDELSVYEWARSAVDEVLGGLENQFDRIQALTGLSVAGNVQDIVSDLFTTFQVPASQRRQVLDTLVEAENLSMYTVMNAITQTANTPGLSEDRIDKILRIGGAVPNMTFASDKARVWSEGHIAGENARNPYEIV